MIIRAERPSDYAAIRKMLASAFGGGQEASLVEALRAEGAINVALVAELDGRVGGHVVVSRLRSPVGGMALAPVAVEPTRQNQGVGSALVREAIDRAKGAGGQIMFVLGDPAYYRRFGFSTEASAAFQSPYAGPHFMALPLTDAPVVGGAVSYPAAFDKLS